MDEILRNKKIEMRRRFREQTQKSLRHLMPGDLPDGSLEAFEMGLQIGHDSGYGEGLVDGVSLGIDVLGSLPGPPPLHGQGRVC
jgi:hypothetical protein